MSDQVSARTEKATLRRAPKYAVFLGLGAVLGLVVAVILTVTFDGTSAPNPDTGFEYTIGQAFMFLVLVCVPVGVALGAVVGLIFDRAFARRSREVTIERDIVHVAE